MKKKKIVVIDDERDICYLLTEILEQTGKYEVYSAHNGEEGELLAVAEKPDLIFLDYIMPKAKGNEVLRYLRTQEATKDTPVVLMSGLGWALSMEECDPFVSWIRPEKNGKDQVSLNGHGWKRAPDDVIENYGIVIFLAKPFSSQTLMFIIDKALAEATRFPVKNNNGKKDQDGQA